MLEVVAEIDGRPLTDLGLRRRGRRHPDRLDRLRLLGRWTGRLAGRRGPAARADQRARAVRPAARARPELAPRRSRWCPTPWAPACCGATAGAPSTCRPARGSRWCAPQTPVRLARLSTSPFTDRLVAKFDLSVHGWRGEARREDAARTAQPHAASLTGAVGRA